MTLYQSFQSFSGQPLPRQVILSLLGEYKRPNDKISELVKQGILLRVRRNLFVPGPNLHIQKPEYFLVANHMFGPSYVSFESALSYWGLIPEQTAEISSATTLSSQEYNSEIGKFTYRHLPLPYYAFGVRQEILVKGQTALVASPEKALCDKIVTTSGLQLRSKVQTLSWLVDDLRIDTESLAKLDGNTVKEWVKKAPKKNSISALAKTLLEL